MARQGGLVGLVPVTAAMEGLRALAKSAARSWGAQGFTANCIAVADQLFLGPGMEAPASPTRNTEALGRAPDARREIAPVVAFLVGDGGAAVTGATITVDGGVVMTP